MRYENGVPGAITDLDVEPARNNPYGSERREIMTLVEHIRALSGFVAQLRDRIEALENEKVT